MSTQGTIYSVGRVVVLCLVIVAAAQVLFPSGEAVSSLSSSIRIQKAEGFNNTAEPSPQLSSLLKPLQVMEEYKQWHSQASLERQPHDRSFALAYYSCPHRGGNILHSLWNGVIWAILTNRTLLLRYEHTDGQGKGTEAECQAILQRASWIPLYEEWYDKLGLPPPVSVKMNTQFTKQRFYTISEQQQSLKEPVVVFPQIGAIQSRNDNLTRISWTQDPQVLTRRSWKNFVHFHRQPYMQQTYGKFLLVAKQRYKRLYQEGRPFLYGMLFRQFFHIRVADTTNIPQYHLLNQSSDTATTTIAMHSRHPRMEDDGSDVTDEVTCLQKILAKRRSLFDNTTKTANNSSCIIYIMSDRVATKEKITEWISSHDIYQCQVQSAAVETIKNQNQAKQSEHGPMAGAGFWMDLAFCGQARSALVGDLGRSSTALLYNLMEYDVRVEEAANHVGDRNRPRRRRVRIEVCDMPHRKVS